MYMPLLSTYYVPETVMGIYSHYLVCLIPTKESICYAIQVTFSHTH